MEEDHAGIPQCVPELHVTSSFGHAYICFLEEVFISPFLFFALIFLKAKIGLEIELKQNRKAGIK